ncbi:hypothetical protein M7I_7233 [Glarea lozoyensis 74030]|uniref:Uncharacterized protein n=1 Tax=Glarea lozoyensis (strain ATCC 74030 / MF5533) TaxID=1104152 RepID=H0EWR0_GLAL7|nr:hypothetical protein M7I_7233 [Glarea lozoyensis 74030]
MVVKNVDRVVKARPWSGNTFRFSSLIEVQSHWMEGEKHFQVEHDGCVGEEEVVLVESKLLVRRGGGSSSSRLIDRYVSAERGLKDGKGKRGKAATERILSQRSRSSDGLDTSERADNESCENGDCDEWQNTYDIKPTLWMRMGMERKPISAQHSYLPEVPRRGTRTTIQIPPAISSELHRLAQKFQEQVCRLIE